MQYTTQHSAQGLRINLNGNGYEQHENLMRGINTAFRLAMTAEQLEQRNDLLNMLALCDLMDALIPESEFFSDDNGRPTGTKEKYEMVGGFDFNEDKEKLVENLVFLDSNLKIIGFKKFPKPVKEKDIEWSTTHTKRCHSFLISYVDGTDKKCYATYVS